jgi:DNA-binding Lrp family transcriptional regulator
MVDIQEVPLDALDRRLIEEYQRDLPLCPEPYAAMGEALGVSEEVVLDRLGRLQERGVLSRVGAVIAPHRTGWSTLAAMAVPQERLDEVAELVNACPEVNHNYAREHRLNLWFVVTAASRERVADVLADIAGRSGLEVLDLPLERAYGIDLGFKPSWS